jgi:hypothetical protein
MLTFSKLRRRPRHFHNFTGLQVAEFEVLLREVKRVYAALEAERLTSRVRERAVGGGAQFHLDVSERLLSTLMYYRLYVTGALLSYLFDLDQSNLSRERNERMLPALLEVLPIPMRDHLLSNLQAEKESQSQSRPRRKKRIGTLEELFEAHPEFEEVWLDATEQEVPKPQDQQQRKQRYSGKAKCHTLKTQVTISTTTQRKALVLHVFGALPGSLHDRTVLRASGVLRRVPPQTLVRMDRGYEGVEEEYPEVEIHKPVRARRNAKITALGRAYNVVQSRLRMPVEHLLGRLQKFQVLHQKYRGPAHRHEDVFALVAGINNFKALANLQWV